MKKNIDAEKSEIAEAIYSGLKKLGTADACTPFGALEFHALEIKNAGEAISSAILELAEAIREQRAQ
jgi:hypothetical protein